MQFLVIDSCRERQSAGLTRKLVITNEQHYEKDRTVVALSKVPEKGEIQESLERVNL
ncbi:hypothetical protein D922_04075 [Enterococcus faecalis 06-MB-DW-09]|nr:hypothetical protein D922_04075 [Enterococcus faecalis 06-MB-DW-09]